MMENLRNSMNVSVRGIKALIVLAGMLAFTLTSCQNDAVAPQGNEQVNQLQDKNDKFATDDDPYKPPREGSGGSGSGGSGG